jgi:DNA processing protein
MSVSTEKLAKAVALTELSGVADGRAKELIHDFGSPEAVYEATFEDFQDYYYIDDSTYNDLQNIDNEIETLENRFEECLDRNIELIPEFDSRYPDRLKSVSGPLLLYARGNVSLLYSNNSIGFTGTREASTQAVKWTKEIAEFLADSDRVIISGGATGVDTAAHHGALAADGDTIVVLGTGIDVPYPESNEALFERIVDNNGLILSQRPPDAKPSRSGFLSRNKTLTGLSQTVSVVATDGTGGTMSTYEDAVNQDRAIVCPDPELELNPTEGIEQILQEDGAIPITDPNEILAMQRDGNNSLNIKESESKPDKTDQMKFDQFK